MTESKEEMERAKKHCDGEEDVEERRKKDN